MFSNYWVQPGYPHHLPAQHFAVGLHHDRLHGIPSTAMNSSYHHAMQGFRNYYHPIFNQGSNQRGQGLSVGNMTKDKYQVALDVQQFSPDEIKVKVVDNYVVVEGKHDEKPDEHGSVMRQFIRRYLIPEQCDIDKVSSSLSSDGVLTLNVPHKIQTENAQKERIVNIEHTGKPAVSFGIDKEISEVDEERKKATGKREPPNEPIKNGDNVK